MRMALVVLVGASLLSAGCSLIIANCGKDLDKVASRDQAREELGRLVESGEKDGEEYDVFHYHGKVQTTWIERASMGMGLGYTSGLAEFVYLPRELFNLGRGVVFGQEVRVWYDQNGRVTGRGSEPPSHQDNQESDAAGPPPLAEPP